MKLKNIYEDLFTKWIDESLIDEDYPTSWNVDEFAALSSHAKRIEYANTNLKFIAGGSGRRVYQIDDEKVLKLATNKKGIAQNEMEIKYGAEDYYMKKIGRLANVFEYDENNNLWVEMELARKLSKSLFKKINGYSWDTYVDLISYYYYDTMGKDRYGRTKETPDDVAQEIYEHEFYSDIAEMVGNYDLPIGDWVRLSSFGIVKRDGTDEVVVIDYGLNNEVYSSYYT